MQGTLKQHVVPGGVVIDLSLRVHGSLPGRLRVRLAGAPLGSGGLSLAGSQVDFAAVGLPAALAGTVVSLQGPRFLARLSDGTGSSADLEADLSIGQSGGVTGTVSGTVAGSGG